MEKCGCRSVTGYPDGGSFSLTNVNLTMPLRIDSNARDGMAFSRWRKTLLIVAGKLTLQIVTSVGRGILARTTP
jgi:hypothetical protein